MWGNSNLKTISYHDTFIFSVERMLPVIFHFVNQDFQISWKRKINVPRLDWFRMRTGPNQQMFWETELKRSNWQSDLLLISQMIKIIKQIWKWGIFCILWNSRSAMSWHSNVFWQGLDLWDVHNGTMCTMACCSLRLLSFRHFMFWALLCQTKIIMSKIIMSKMTFLGTMVRSDVCNTWCYC